MRVHKPFVDPIARLFRQLIDIKLTGRDHHLPHLAANRVTVNIDIRKVVVGSDLLDLPQRVLESVPIPQADVGERAAVCGQIERGGCYVSGVIANLDILDIETGARAGDVVFDIRRLAVEFVRFNDKALNICRNKDSGRQINQGRRPEGNNQETSASFRKGIDEENYRSHRKGYRDNRQAG